MHYNGEVANNNINIQVSDYLKSPFAVTTEEGDILFEQISGAIDRKQIVSLDFAGIELIISTFLNASIGQLYGKYSTDQIKEFLQIKNMSGDDLMILKKVTDRAKEYFKDKKGMDGIFKNYFNDAESDIVD